ncbi:bactofilin family protein [Entomospira culicis]|uniref:Polymer-forming cytoskeletal protein n=1 Tax=Entomospira culicis TaxID=2719989 RepID=A0A968GEK7_9SPIO|nr:polymer-forming cytoskeletal protein [Entomospira culicis]NIZ18899.1 polymer-forming cytoskeletal protein [Entomospira culicis]NIZ69114.1 polymer-forming cytoskeletal protein [Entomospira culicis]WDI37700.1 polymer-forming cytoskeletal protein [Entomospira culicis]WDI39328.1 polymer-forming cytoskeletal protein [Entomospira culicis]
MPEIHAKKIDETVIETVLQEDVVLEGNVSSSRGIAIKGKVTGNLNAKENILIDKHAQVIGRVDSETSLYLLGSLKGDVKTTARVEIIGKGVLDGDVITGRMVIENGTTFNGICKMG